MKKSVSPRTFCVAPMMGRTDRHFLHLLRLLSRRTMFYTEMVTTQAMLRTNRARQSFEAFQRPLALQLAGNNLTEMASCARIGEELGFDEINVNLGCPSPRATQGTFGACLMKEPQLVADCIAAMSACTSIPITAKCRIGVENSGVQEKQNESEIFDRLCRFTDTVSAAGCDTFIIHARNAVLGGLNTRQNLKIPKLRYELVRSLKLEFPRLEIILNGGIKTLSQAKSELSELDGVMLGRAIYRQPMMLAQVDSIFYGEKQPKLLLEDVIGVCLEYLTAEVRRGTSGTLVTRHLMNWFHGQRNANRWRRYLSEDLPRCGWRNEPADWPTLDNHEIPTRTEHRAISD